MGLVAQALAVSPRNCSGPKGAARWLYRALCLAALACPAVATAADTVVLDESAYCRAYVQFGLDRLAPEKLKGACPGASPGSFAAKLQRPRRGRTEAETLLSKRQFTAIKRAVKRVHGLMRRKWDEKTWRDHAYDLDGKGIKGFSAEVGIPDHWYTPYGAVGPDGVRLNFEIHVDGALRTQSGMIGPKEKARLIAVSGLENAKKMTLIVRPLLMPTDWTFAVWGAPTLYK